MAGRRRKEKPEGLARIWSCPSCAVTVDLSNDETVDTALDEIAKHKASHAEGIAAGDPLENKLAEQAGERAEKPTAEQVLAAALSRMEQTTQVQAAQSQQLLRAVDALIQMQQSTQQGMVALLKMANEAQGQGGQAAPSTNGEVNHADFAASVPSERIIVAQAEHPAQQQQPQPAQSGGLGTILDIAQKLGIFGGNSAQQGNPFGQLETLLAGLDSLDARLESMSNRRFDRQLQATRQVAETTKLALSAGADPVKTLTAISDGASAQMTPPSKSAE